MTVGCVCEDGSLRAALREDFDRYVFSAEMSRAQGVERRLSPRWESFLQRGLWATTVYRLAHYARHSRRSRWLSPLAFVFQQVILTLTSIEISPAAHIGPGLWIPHEGYIVIGPVPVGRNCEIFQGVTLGARQSTIPRTDPGPGIGVPTLGDRVWVGPGAVITGRITVGDDATVGANSLVTRDVPPRGVMLGVPARLISRRGSFNQIAYRGMDADEGRKASLAADPEAGQE